MKRLIVVLLALPLASCFHVNNRTPYDQGSNLTHLLNFYENECLKPASNHEYPFDPDRAEICKIVKSKIASYNVDSIAGNASNSKTNLENSNVSAELKSKTAYPDDNKSVNINSSSNTKNSSNSIMSNAKEDPMLGNKENSSNSMPVASVDANNNEPTTPATINMQDEVAPKPTSNPGATNNKVTSNKPSKG
ncbi:hypothetical protein HPDP_00313 [Candidatus Hepatincola sp. Pdp]